MKKLLGSLASVIIAAAPISSVVACGANKADDNDVAIWAEMGFQDDMKPIISNFKKEFPQYKNVNIHVVEKSYGDLYGSMLIQHIQAGDGPAVFWSKLPMIPTLARQNGIVDIDTLANEVYNAGGVDKAKYKTAQDFADKQVKTILGNINPEGDELPGMYGDSVPTTKQLVDNYGSRSSDPTAAAGENWYNKVAYKGGKVQLGAKGLYGVTGKLDYLTWGFNKHKIFFNGSNKLNEVSANHKYVLTGIDLNNDGVINNTPSSNTGLRDLIAVPQDGIMTNADYPYVLPEITIDHSAHGKDDKGITDEEYQQVFESINYYSLMASNASAYKHDKGASNFGENRAFFNIIWNGYDTYEAPMKTQSVINKDYQHVFFNKNNVNDLMTYGKVINTKDEDSGFGVYSDNFFNELATYTYHWHEVNDYTGYLTNEGAVTKPGMSKNEMFASKGYSSQAGNFVRYSAAERVKEHGKGIPSYISDKYKNTDGNKAPTSEDFLAARWINMSTKDGFTPDYTKTAETGAKDFTPSFTGVPWLAARNYKNKPVQLALMEFLSSAAGQSPFYQSGDLWHVGYDNQDPVADKTNWEFHNWYEVNNAPVFTKDGGQFTKEADEYGPTVVKQINSVINSQIKKASKPLDVRPDPSANGEDLFANYFRQIVGSYSKTADVYKDIYKPYEDGSENFAQLIRNLAEQLKNYVFAKDGTPTEGTQLKTNGNTFEAYIYNQAVNNK